jgi:hypothetical protein
MKQRDMEVGRHTVHARAGTDRGRYSSRLRRHKNTFFQLKTVKTASLKQAIFYDFAKMQCMHV